MRHLTDQIHALRQKKSQDLHDKEALARLKKARAEQICPNDTVYVPETCARRRQVRSKQVGQSRLQEDVTTPRHGRVQILRNVLTDLDEEVQVAERNVDKMYAELAAAGKKNTEALIVSNTRLLQLVARFVPHAGRELALRLLHVSRGDGDGGPSAQKENNNNNDLGKAIKRFLTKDIVRIAKDGYGSGVAHMAATPFLQAAVLRVALQMLESLS